MKKIVIALCICLAPISVWSAEKISSDMLRKEAEEDLCYAYTEYGEAQNVFMRETGGSYRPSSPGGRLARDKDLKMSRLVTLQGRYSKRYGQEFNPLMNPKLCFGAR